jgi:hypothetical protein
MKHKRATVISALVVVLLLSQPAAAQEMADKARVVEKAEERLSKVKVALQYRYVTDGEVINRSLTDVIKILKETNTDFLFQGWLTQWPLPEKCSDLDPKMRAKCESAGYSYEYVKEAIREIKKELPDILFCAGTQFEYLYPDEIAGKDEKERRDKAWAMTLNPEKWGLKASRKDMQCYWARKWGIVNRQSPSPSEEKLKSMMRHYFPDITNKDFQEVFLKRIFKQIDAGAGAIWIDMLYVQPAYLLRELAGRDNHPAVQESYKAVWEIVDKIHNYGLKKGRYIYVITWVAGLKDGSITVIPKTNVDIAMLSPLPDEIRDKSTGIIGNFDEKLWQELVGKINKQLGIPIFVRIDYGGGGRSPLGVFSQELTPGQAKSFLMAADDFFKKLGATFIYPVHGGDMGPKEKVKKLSYGQFNWYDALVPEFETYNTIKKLAQEKTKGEK